MTNEQSEKQLQEQKLDAIKWRDLQCGMIYIITNAEYINTQYGEACILTLSDGKRVLAPSALMNRLKQESGKPFPRYVRPKGKTKSKEMELNHTMLNQVMLFKKHFDI